MIYDIASFFQSKGVGINVHNPLIRGGGTYLQTITHLTRSYSHTISALGGFTDANIQMSGDQSFIEDWYTDGLGRHIVVTGAGGVVVWEGFVNSIEIHLGAYTATRGPLLNIANRVSAMYTPIIDPLPDPPITGTETETVIAEDANSQQRYGIWEKVISAGTVLDEDALYIRNTFLEDNREPEINASVSLGSGNADTSVTLSCRGYIDWLNYAFNDPDNLLVTASTKIGDVVTAEPNSIFSTDQSYIGTNGILVSSYEDGNRMAKAIIDEIVSMGDIFDNRWLYGCYENRKVYYYAAPTESDYSTHLTFPEQSIYYRKAIRVDPWDVRPGKWMELLDFRALGITPANMYENPSMVFLEDVQYTAPNQVNISGAKIKRVTQLLARMGLG